MSRKINSIPFDLLIVLILGALFLGFPFLFRILFYEKTIPGDYGYSHPGAYGWLSLLDFVPFTDNNLLILWISTFSVAFFLIIMLYKVSKKHSSDKLMPAAILLFFIFTPITIYFSYTPSPYPFALILLLMSCMIFNSRHKYYTIMPLAALLLFDWVVFLSASIFMISYLLLNNKSYKIFYIFLYLAAFLLVNILLPRPLSFQFIPHQQAFTVLVSELGSIHGIGILTLLLSFAGFIKSWRYKLQYAPSYFTFTALLLLTFFLNEAFIYFLYPIIIFFAAYMFVHFWRYVWALNVVRLLTLLAIAAGIAVSGIAHIAYVVPGEPTSEMLESAEWLSNHPFYSEQTVLSHPKNGFWLNFDGKQRSFINYNSHEYNEKLKLTEAIFQSRSFQRTASMLTGNDISLILIDDAMKSGVVWDGDEEGLLFVLKDENFIKIYDYGGIEIWRLR